MATANDFIPTQKGQAWHNSHYKPFVQHVMSDLAGKAAADHEHPAGGGTVIVTRGGDSDRAASGKSLHLHDNGSIEYVVDGSAEKTLMTEVKQRHIIRFSLMGVVQTGNILISMLSGVNGTAKKFGMQVDSTGATATASLVRWSGGSSQTIKSGAVAVNSGAEWDLNVGISTLDYWRIDVTATSGSPRNLRGYIVIEEA